jgi:RNA polymerase sigma-70 factor (ECF subfamily)
MGKEDEAKTDGLSDEAIALAVQRGDKEAFGILIDRYEKKLTRYARRFLSGKETIEDLVQDVFLKTYQNLQSFDPNLKFQSWIYRIAHNTFISGLKRLKKSPFHFFDFDTLLSYSAIEPVQDDAAEDAQLQLLIEQTLDTLPAKYAEVLILHFSEGLSYKEVSDVLEVPPGTVAVRINRAKALLKEQIKKKHGT